MTRHPTWPAVLVLLCSDCTRVDLCPKGSTGGDDEDRCVATDASAADGTDGDEPDGASLDDAGDHAEPVNGAEDDAGDDAEPVNGAEDDAALASDAELTPSDAGGAGSDGGGDANGSTEPVGVTEEAGAEEAGVGTGRDATVDGSTWGGTTPGDGDGDGRCDLALTGARDMSGIPTAFSNGDGTFHVVESTVADFPSWAAAVGVQPVAGDFDGDGLRDIALLGASSSVSFAFSDGRSGAFRVEQCEAAEFAAWSRIQGNRPISGDFDADGLSDVALVGAPGAASIPVAFMREGCVVEVTNYDLVDFPSWGAHAGAQAVSGDFDGNGSWDIALTGMAGAWTIPVAFSEGDGKFRVSNADVGDFPEWAQVQGNKAVPGDFNGDGRGDIALTGAPGSWSIAVALSVGDGHFDVTNAMLMDFPTWAEQAGVKPVPGDFDRDGCGDIALVGGTAASTIPVAFSRCDGSFRVTNAAVDGFPSWAQQAGMSAVGGY